MCSRSIRLDDLQFDRTMRTCEICQGFESSNFDMNIQRGGFRCLACRPESLGEQVLDVEIRTVQALVSSFVENPRFNSDAFPRHMGSPPTGLVVIGTNSFLYCPALLAAARLLEDADVER